MNKGQLHQAGLAADEATKQKKAAAAAKKKADEEARAADLAVSTAHSLAMALLTFFAM